MLPFNDLRWVGLLGGYRVPYDPRQALQSLQNGLDVEEAWSELWQELHHQGNVGEASYAAVPYIVQICAQQVSSDWNPYALVAVIEESRQSHGNPDLPEWLRESYEAAWKQLSALAQRDYQAAHDPTLVCSILSVLAFAKGQNTLGQMALLTEAKRAEMLNA